MPIYEYQCTDCGHRLEALQKFTDPPLKECPACARPGLRKLVSAASFRLKGGGWYETDFKQGGKKNLAGEAGAVVSAGDSAQASGKNAAGDSTVTKSGQSPGVSSSSTGESGGGAKSDAVSGKKGPAPTAPTGGKTGAV